LVHYKGPEKIKFFLFDDFVKSSPAKAGLGAQKLRREAPLQVRRNDSPCWILLNKIFPFGSQSLPSCISEGEILIEQRRAEAQRRRWTFTKPSHLTKNGGISQGQVDKEEGKRGEYLGQR
jgi:hypothetical protein